jgi:putative transposase
VLDRILDADFFREAGGAIAWRELHGQADRVEQIYLLRRCTYAGRPFGDEAFVAEVEERFQRRWRRWGFEQQIAAKAIG